MTLRQTLACFEPTIDYVVTKIPRWTFEKFPEADPTLTVQMKSVGETMAIGRTFRESLQKALRGLEIGHFGLGGGKKDLWGTDKQPTREEIQSKLAIPNAERIFYLRYALKFGMSVEHIHETTDIDPWFLRNLEQLVRLEDEIRLINRLEDASPELIRRAKKDGFSDAQLAFWWDCSQIEVRQCMQGSKHCGHVQTGRYVRLLSLRLIRRIIIRHMKWKTKHRPRS